MNNTNLSTPVGEAGRRRFVGSNMSMNDYLGNEVWGFAPVLFWVSLTS